MDNPSIPDSPETNESFSDILSRYEHGRSRKTEDGARQLEGTVIAISADLVFLDIGYKSEGVIPLTVFQEGGRTVSPGDKMPVAIKGRNPEGYYELALGKVSRPTDWSALEQAFASKAAVLGTVTAAVKGGVSVDVGVRAFMPASRSGARDAAELEKLVGQEIRCRIIKLDVADEDVVVDRRAVAEDEARQAQERRYSDLKEGEVIQATVRSLMDYGAFVDLGGVDALLHVGDISWQRISKPSDVLSAGQQVEVKVLKIDTEKRRISVGMKQMQPDPWLSVAERYASGNRARGVVTRIVDFGAFVELEPGVEGLIHISDMSWAKKVRTAADIVKPGENVEAVILGVNAADRRIALGLKQALGDPWADVGKKYAVGSVVEGPVTNLAKFGAFVQLSEGVEGMIHISEISDEKRINHPQDVLKAGQIVRAQVLAIDTERRTIRLGMKQLIPTTLDEYIAEHKSGDVVTGRVIEESAGSARIELGEGIQGTCRVESHSGSEQGQASPKVDLSSLTSMLQARWKGGAGGPAAKQEELRAGQIRSFRIARLDSEAKKIELELAANG